MYFLFDIIRFGLLVTKGGFGGVDPASIILIESAHASIGSYYKKTTQSVVQKTVTSTRHSAF